MVRSRSQGHRQWRRRIGSAQRHCQCRLRQTKSMHTAKPRTLPLAALLLTMLIWGSTFVVTKAAAVEIPVLGLSFLRFLIAALVLLPIVVARGGLKRSPRMTFGVLGAMSLTGMVLFALGFNYGLVFASA